MHACSIETASNARRGIMVCLLLALAAAGCAHPGMGAPSPMSPDNSSSTEASSQLCHPRTFLQPLPHSSKSIEIRATSRGVSANDAAGSYGFTAAMKYASCIASWSSSIDSGGLTEIVIVPAASLSNQELEFLVNRIRLSGVFSNVRVNHIANDG